MTYEMQLGRDHYPEPQIRLVVRYVLFRGPAVWLLITEYAAERESTYQVRLDAEVVTCTGGSVFITSDDLMTLLRRSRTFRLGHFSTSQP